MAETYEPTAPAETAVTPFCSEIRSKKYFTLKAIPMTEADILDPSGHCWCRQTMQVVGPDGEMVEPKECKPGRSCYKSQW
jgi:hypothetical protein